MKAPSFVLTLRDGAQSVCRLPPGDPVPEWAAGSFVSITRTPTELSVTCATEAVPPDVATAAGCEGPFRALEVSGPLDFSMVGVLSRLTAALAEAEVSVFVVSTFDTDWILVPEPALGRAVWALRGHGHEVLGHR